MDVTGVVEAGAPVVEKERDISHLKTPFDPSTLVRKGLCPVSELEGANSVLERHSLYYEQHGTGPEKIVFVMGLNASCFGWIHQINHFSNLEKYSLLVFDNRGVGNSDAPRGPYTTSGMAEDIITLLDYIGWTDPRQLHIVGISMGGMISQELAWKIPERIASLSLMATTPGYYLRPLSNTSPPRGAILMGKAVLAKTDEDRIGVVLEMLFPQAYLIDKVPNDPAGRTYAEWQSEGYRDRLRITRRPPLLGFLSQGYAALSHYVSPKRLAKIAHTVPKILVLTGDDDTLVDPINSKRLVDGFTSQGSDGEVNVEYVKWKNTGHGVPVQWPERTNALLEKVFEEGRRRSSV